MDNLLEKNPRAEPALPITPPGDHPAALALPPPLPPPRHVPFNCTTARSSTFATSRLASATRDGRHDSATASSLPQSHSSIFPASSTGRRRSHAASSTTSRGRDRSKEHRTHSRSAKSSWSACRVPHHAPESWVPHHAPAGSPTGASPPPDSRRRSSSRAPAPASKREKERKKTDNPREGWEDGTPPPHRDFKERGVVH